MSYSEICPACGNKTSKLIKHQFKQYPKDERIICQDCHKAIEWYNRELDDIKAKQLE